MVLDSNDANREQAEAWYARLRSGDISERERKRFRVWLAADPEHIRAFDRVNDVWRRLDPEGEAARQSWPELDREFLDLVDTRGGLTTSARTPESAARRYVRLAAAACAFVVVAGAIGLATISTPPGTSYTTGRAEVRTLSLADGSVVHMNADSDIRVEMSLDFRKIGLEEGEALFEVAPDAARPFVVSAGDATIRALGTEFNVNRNSQEVTVTVLEGTVQVSQLPNEKLLSRTPVRRTVSRGEQIEYQVNGKLGDVAASEPDTAVAWRRGELVFDNKPLASALEDINRHLETRIVAPDPRISELRISGVFKSGDAASVIDGLTMSFPVRAISVGPYLRILVAADTPSNNLQ